MSDVMQLVWPAIVTAGLVILQMFFSFAKKKWNLSDVHSRFMDAVLAFVQREKDGLIADMSAARSEDSDGGAVITPAEKDIILNNLWERFKNDPSIKDDIKSYALDQGADFVKGLASKLLGKM